MNETELLARLREEVPLEDASAQAERLFLAGLSGPAGSPRRARLPMARWWGRSHLTGRLALAGGLSLALAASAATVAGLVGGPGGVVTGAAHSGGARVAPAVREVAYRAAAAAGRQPPVQPGQWVYWKEMITYSDDPSPFEVWTTADQTKAAFVDHGKVYPVNFPALGKNIPAPKQYIGQPQGKVIPAAHGGGTDFSGVTGTLAVPYADLGSLPGSPDALNRYLAGLAARDPGPQAAQEFLDIEDMIISYVMPPQLTAELYRVLGDIPGVTLSEHAVDIAGRAGIAVVSPPFADGSRDEIIVNPSTYQLMGVSSIDLSPPARVGEAILGEALVSGPGVHP